MGDHYIPQFYLKGFTETAYPDLIWVYRKGEESAFRTSIRNIAQENKFYSRDMEQYLANKVEEPANKVLRMIRKLQALTYEDKVTFSKYMMVLWKRVPEHKKWVNAKAPEIMNPVFERIDKEINRRTASIAEPGEIAHLNRSKPHRGERENAGKIIVHQVCGMDRYPRNFL